MVRVSYSYLWEEWEPLSEEEEAWLHKSQKRKKKKWGYKKTVACLGKVPTLVIVLLFCVSLQQKKHWKKKFGLKSNFPWCNALFFYRYPFPSSCLSFNESFTILDMRYTKSTHAPPSKFLCRATECASATSKSFALFAKSSSSQPLNQTIKKTKTLWSLKLMWKCSGTATISPNNRQCSCINTYKDGRVRKREWKYDYLLIRCVPFIARAFKSPLLLSRSYSTYLVLDDTAAMNVTCTRKQTKKERQTFTL